MADIQEELGAKYKVRYFEVGEQMVGSDHVIRELREYLVGCALESYEAVEKRRYVKVEPLAKHRDCGIESCSIF